jgi:microsomal dipeptidase-like Zn-dependent dipeptidase
MEEETDGRYASTDRKMRRSVSLRQVWVVGTQQIGSRVAEEGHQVRQLQRAGRRGDGQTWNGQNTWTDGRCERCRRWNPGG